MDLQLEEVRDRLADRRITLDVTPAAMEHLSIDGYDPVSYTHLACGDCVEECPMGAISEVVED